MIQNINEESSNEKRLRMLDKEALRYDLHNAKNADDEFNQRLTKFNNDKKSLNPFARIRTVKNLDKLNTARGTKNKFDDRASKTQSRANKDEEDRQLAKKAFRDNIADKEKFRDLVKKQKEEAEKIFNSRDDENVSKKYKRSFTLAETDDYFKDKPRRHIIRYEDTNLNQKGNNDMSQNQYTTEGLKTDKYVKSIDRFEGTFGNKFIAFDLAIKDVSTAKEKAKLIARIQATINACEKELKKVSKMDAASYARTMIGGAVKGAAVTSFTNVMTNAKKRLDTEQMMLKQFPNYGMNDDYGKKVAKNVAKTAGYGATDTKKLASGALVGAGLSLADKKLYEKKIAQMKETLEKYIEKYNKLLEKAKAIEIK